jgi:hypothetical protein
VPRSAAHRVHQLAADSFARRAAAVRHRAVGCVYRDRVFPVEGEPVDPELVTRAMLSVAFVTVVVWLGLVWPSIRLGFRVKRGIFAAGCDLRHPFWAKPGLLTWAAFPRIDIYALENSAFTLLGTRKKHEFPVDLVFALTPWVAIAWLILTLTSLPSVFHEWRAGEIDLGAFMGPLLLNTLIVVSAINQLWFGIRNVRNRPK